MTRVSVVVGCLLLVASCGDRSQVEPQAAPGTAAPVAATSLVPVPVPDATAVVTNPSVPVATTAPEAIVTVAPGEAVVPIEPTTDTLFPGDVSIDDPLPPQADAVSDPAVAEVAVRYAMTHWILVDLDPVLRGMLVENSDVGAPELDARLKENRGLVQCARLDVDVVQFTDAEHALVKFWVNCGQSRSSYFTGELTGGAVYQDGTWRIAGRTLCVMAFSAGLDCDRLDPANPPSPAGFDVTSVPDGYRRADGAHSNVIVTDGQGLWVRDGQPVPSTIVIDVQSLAGVSALAPEDTDFVLLTPHYGVSTGDDLQVGGRPARAAQLGAGAALVVVRDDDVVIRISAAEATVSELVAIAEGMTPILSADSLPPATDLAPSSIDIPAISMPSPLPPMSTVLPPAGSASPATSGG